MGDRRCCHMLQKWKLLLTMVMMHRPGLSFLSSPASLSSLAPRRVSAARSPVETRQVAVAGSSGGGTLEGGAASIGSASAGSSSATPSPNTKAVGRSLGKKATADTPSSKLRSASGARPKGSSAELEAEAAMEELKEGVSLLEGAKGSKASPESNAPSIPQVPPPNTRGNVSSKETEAPQAAAAVAAARAGRAVGDSNGGDATELAMPEGPAASRGTAKRKNKSDVAAAPETTAAEKVLSLLDLGLVDKDEVAAYYDALSDLERTTREAKEASLAGPVSSSKTRQLTPPEELFDLLPFPAACAALGAVGAHSMHLTGDLDNVACAFGAAAGAGLGSLVIAGDDPVGRTARSIGSAMGRSASNASGLAGKSIAKSAAGAAGSAVAAAEQAIVTAPVNFASGIARSLSSRLSAAIGSVIAFPGELARKAVGGAKGALQDSSAAAVNLPGNVARKAAKAAGGALQSASEAAITAVKDSPKNAADRVKKAVSTPGETLAAFVSSSSRMGAGGSDRPPKADPAATQVSAADSGQESRKSPSEDNNQSREALEEIPLEELEAKMSSVQEALERFDAVKSRIEKTQTSGTLLETVGMARNIDLTAERERGEAARAATKKARDNGVDGVAGTRSRPPPATATAAAERTPIDEDRRKQVAEQLLEKASRRATEAKAGLKAAAASARRDAGKDKAADPAADSGVGQPDPQFIAASS